MGVPFSRSTLILETALITLVPLVAISLLIVMLYAYRRHKMVRAASLLGDQAHLSKKISSSMTSSESSTPLLNQFAAQLLEIKGSGRYGQVWKASLDDDVIAVKVFAASEFLSFSAERDFYTLPQICNQENILKFIGVDSRGSDDDSDTSVRHLWLLTEYHERGSLYDHLKAYTVTWKEMLHITQGLTAGLAFLHDEAAATKEEAIKPSVAHRDIKSKNVLLKHDLTACIGDFGLALIMKPNEKVSDKQVQVRLHLTSLLSTSTLSPITSPYPSSDSKHRPTL